MRARRARAHSLGGDLQRLRSIREGTITVMVAGDEQTMVLDLPPEEQMESLAARVRPVILEREDTFHSKALEAIGFLGVGRLPPRAVEVLTSLREAWKCADDKQVDVRGYLMQVRRPDGSSAEASDRVLAWGWFYGDVVHADVERLALTDGFDVFYRYRAACLVVADIAYRTAATLDLIQELVSEGVIELDVTTFEVEVVAGETRREMKGRVYTADVGTTALSAIDEPLGDRWSVLGSDESRGGV